MMRCRIIAFLLALAPALWLSGCSKEAPQEDRKSTLVYAFDENLKTFDPLHQIYAQESAILQLVMDTLVRWSDDLKIEPALATSWESKDDCKTWVFHLRQGVLFHDGTPFNSAAIKSQMDRFLDPKTAASRAHNLKHLESIETPDDYTIIFHLKESDCVFLELMTNTWSAIYSPAAYEQYGDDIAKHPVGTGAFVFDSWDQNAMVVKLHRNPSYWKGDVIKFENLELQQVVEKTTRLTLLEQGSVDIASIAAEHVSVAKQNPDIVVESAPYLSVVYTGFNCQKPPFNDKRVRQACNYAVDRDSIVAHVFQGNGTPAYGPFPESLPDYNHNLKKYTYDPAKAKALLAEAGYPNGINVVMWTQELGSYSKVSEAVVEYLRKVGVNIEVQRFDNAVYWDKFDEYLSPTGEKHPLKEGCFDLFVGGWVGGESAMQFLDPLFRSISTSNNSFYANPEVDRLLTEVKDQPSEQARRELMAKMQDIIVEDAPWIFTYYGQSNVGCQPRVKGFKPNGGGLLYFDGVTLDEKK